MLIHLRAGWLGQILKNKINGKNTSRSKAAEKVGRHCCTVLSLATRLLLGFILPSVSKKKFYQQTDN